MTPRVWVKASLAIATAGLLAFSAYGQNKGGGATTTPPSGGTTGGGTTTTPGRTGTTTTTTPSTTQTPVQNSIPQPIFVSGRVALEDGSAPPEPAVIETVCNGTPHG